MNANYQKLIPLHDRVIIEPVKPPEKIGSLFVPDQAKDKPGAGTVVAVGQGRTTDTGHLVPPTVKVGDNVMFNFYTAAEMDFDGQKLFMIHEHEISCIVKK